MSAVTYDIAIIGAGPTGLFAVFQAGMLGLKVCVIDALNSVGGQCTALYSQKMIYDIPGFHKITAGDLIKNLEEQISPFNPKFFLKQKCFSIAEHPCGWKLSCTSKIIFARTIIIAAGAGSFMHRKPPIKDIELYENKSVFFHIENQKIFNNKIVTIAGGGDSAIDWAVILAEKIAKKVYLVHRRENFRAAPKMVEKMHKLSDIGLIELLTPCQLNKLYGENGKLHEVEVIDNSGKLKQIKTDYLLSFFGMKMDMGFLEDWNLSISNKKYIRVDPVKMQTNLHNVFSIGDICDYPGKLRLILTGFAEAARACHSVYDVIHPERPLHFEHSTTKGIPGDD